MENRSFFNCSDCGVETRLQEFEWYTCSYCGHGYLSDEELLNTSAEVWDAGKEGCPEIIGQTICV